MIKGKAQFAPWSEDPDPPSYWEEDDYEELQRRLRKLDGIDDALKPFDEDLHPRESGGQFAIKGGPSKPDPAEVLARAAMRRAGPNDYGLVPGDVEKFKLLKTKWAQVNSELLEHIDKPDGPESQAKIRELEVVAKQIQGLRADPGTPEGIGLPGGPRDVVVVGAGPGGLAASINGAAEGLDTMVIEANVVAGGQAKYSSRIENFPGFPVGVTGEKLTQSMFEQAKRLGAEAQLGTRVTSMTYDEATGLKHLTLSDGKTITSRAVILAGGVEFRKLTFHGAEGPCVHVGDGKALAKDGAGGHVLVIGGSNGAAQAALGCAKTAKHVYLMARSPIVTSMSDYQVVAVRNHPKITVIEEDSVAKLTRGADGKPQTIETIKGTKLDVDAVGGFIGSVPETKWVPDKVQRDKGGKIHTNKDLMTDLPGVFAVGDMRVGAIGRVGVAVGEGQLALREAHVYLESTKKKKVGDSIADSKSDDPPISALFALDLANPWFGQTVEYDVVPVGDAIRPWDESKHSRGQPKNAGQFGPGGGGATPKTKAAARESATGVLARAAQRPKGAVSSSGGKGDRVQAVLARAKPKAAPAYQLDPASKAALARQRAPGSYEPPPPAKPRAAKPAAAEPKAEVSRTSAEGEVSKSPKLKKAEVPVKKSDFEKAKVRLINMDPEQEAKFIEKWNAKIGIEPDDFKAAFTGGLHDQVDMTLSEAGGTFYVGGTISDKDGRRIGEFDRHLKPDSKSAFSSFFKLNKDAQGGDIGKKILSGNVDVYEALGYDTVKVSANIDIGGYAWAKYGYVPTATAWNSLRAELERKLGGGGGRSSRESSGNTFEADDWNMLSGDQQAETERRWFRDSRDEFLQSEIENWRDSGQALQEAKTDVANRFNEADAPWAMEAMKELRAQRKEDKLPDIPYSDDQIMEALTAQEYQSRYDDGSNEIEFEWNDDKLQRPNNIDPHQKTLPGIEEPDYSKRLTEEMRSEITDKLSREADTYAENAAADMDPPDHLAESVEEYQGEVWDQKEDSEKLALAIDYGQADIEIEDEDEEEEAEEPEKAEADEEQTEEAELLDLLRESDPKNIWKIADSPRGKALLKNTSWAGVLDFRDKESYDRFRTYVSRPPKPKGEQRAA